MNVHANEKNLRVCIRQLPVGLPQDSDFYVEEATIPTPAAGEILCQTQYLALDPYVRALMSGRHFLELPKSEQVLPARSVAQVVESRNSRFSVGDTVLLETGMQSFSKSTGEDARVLDLAPAPVSTALGVLGMPGLTAYAGLTEIAELTPGETILVSAASGSVGSMVSQIGRELGCRVIGIAGGAEKCAWAIENTGVEDCIDYKSESVTERLRSLRENGIDVYFDNAGGEILATVIRSHLARNARIILCGLISQYNLADAPPGPNLGPLMGARARILPLIVYDFERLWDQFEKSAVQWFSDGKIKYVEDLCDGIENAPAHFQRLMLGENFGKTIIRNTLYVP